MENRISVYSEYLEKEFQVEGFTAISDRGRPVTMIYPTSLKKLMNRMIPAEFGARYDLVDVKQTMDHCVARCIITDAKGKRIQEVGEATTQSMTSDIETSHPATTAYQRAFDRAVIQYLQLPDYTYSCSEGIKLKSEKEDPTTIIDLREPIDLPVEEDMHETVTATTTPPVQQPTAVPAPSTETKQNPTVQPANASVAATEAQKAASAQRNAAPVQNKPATAPRQQTAPVAPAAPATQPAASDAPAEDLSAVMCNIGKYRSNPQTLAWVWENDNSYILWLCDSCKANTAATKALKEKCIAYRNMKTGG